MGRSRERVGKDGAGGGGSRRVKVGRDGQGGVGELAKGGKEK